MGVMRDVVRKVLIGAVVLLMVLIASGAAYQWGAARADRQHFPPPGRLVDVDGLKMHIDCHGEGEPVVILEAGLGAGATEWGSVPGAVSGSTEVCAYDRPGLGWSEPIDRTADAAEVADRLQRLLQAAGVGGPYLLVGWSAGGVYVREYYRRHPEGVVGMVLVDSSHEQQGDRLPPTDSGRNVERMVELCGSLQPLGVVRLTGVLDARIDQPTVPAALKPVMRANMNQSHFCLAILDEMRSFEREVHDTDPPSSLGDLPLTVLTQGDEPKGDPTFGQTDEQARAQRVVWNELQEELTALSSRNRHLIAEHSGHPIQLEQPELVIGAVKDMVGDLRRRREGVPVGHQR